MDHYDGTIVLYIYIIRWYLASHSLVIVYEWYYGIFECALFILLLLLIIRLVPAPPTLTRMLAATSERASPHYSPHATA